MATAFDTTASALARTWSRPRVRAAVGVPLVAGAIVLAIRLWLKWVGPFPGDEWALHHLEGRTLPRSIGDLGTFFSVIGTPTVAGLTLLAVLPVVLRSDGVRGMLFVTAAGCGVFFNMLLKWLSGPTPLLVEKFPDIGSQGLNYPSGHTVYGVVFFGSLAWLAWRHRRLEVVLPLLALIAAMGPFRVIVDAHFVSDVLAAYLVGIAWLVPVAIALGVDGGRTTTQA
jgi:undecaprenyl-diphosphatase